MTHVRHGTPTRIVVAAVATAVAACGSDTSRQSALSPLDPAFATRATLTITTRDSVVAVGDSLRLETLASDGTHSSKNNASVRWESLDTAVVSVRYPGVVRGRRVGVARIVATHVWRGGPNRDTARIVVTEANLSTTSTTSEKPSTPVTAAPAPRTPASPTSPVAPTTPAAPVTPLAPFDITRPASAAELPRGEVDTRMPTQTGRTLHVRAGGSLQAALDSARYGDVVTLEPGATFSGNFILRAKKSGTGWIVIRSAVSDASLPAPGTRMTPARAAGLAKIVSPNANGPIMSESAARGYRLVGLDVSTSVRTNLVIGEIIRFGGHPNNVKTLADVGADFILDRSWVHGTETSNLKRCVTLNTDRSAVIDSYLSDCHAKGLDSQAILIWNANGPFLIQNNYLEGAGENIMVGGAEVSLYGPIRPSDITVRRNHFFKPTSWKGRWSVKNIFELKVGHRVLVEENLMENNWIDAQAGFAILLKTNANPKDPGQGTTNVTFRNNVVRNTPAGINIYHGNGNGTSARNIHVEGNLFYNVGTFNGTSVGRMIQLLGPLYDITFHRNTFLSNRPTNGHAVVMEGKVSKNLVMTGNIIEKGNYGFFGSGKGQGNAALNWYWANSYTVRGNLLIGMSASTYPSGNLFPSALADVGLLAPDNGAGEFVAGSRYANMNVGATGTTIASVIRRATAP